MAKPTKRRDERSFDPAIFDSDDDLPKVAAPKPVEQAAPKVEPPRAEATEKPPDPGSEDTLEVEVDGVPVRVPMRVIEGMAAVGCSDADIHRCIGITRGRWDGVLKRRPDLRERIEDSRSKGVRSVVKALFDQAVSGNQNAIVFWLVNRRRADWSGVNHVKVEHSGHVDTDMGKLLGDVKPEDLAERMEALVARIRGEQEKKPKPEEVQ